MLYAITHDEGTAKETADPGEALVEELRGGATSLARALSASRLIGTAIGILAQRDGVTPESAFRALVLLSQQQNRTLRAVAAHLIDTGGDPRAPGPAA